MLYHYFNDGKMERSEGSSITEGKYEGNGAGTLPPI